MVYIYMYVLTPLCTCTLLQTKQHCVTSVHETVLELGKALSSQVCFYRATQWDSVKIYECALCEQVYYICILPHTIVQVSQKYLLNPKLHSDNKKCIVIDLDETLVHSSFKVGATVFYIRTRIYVYVIMYVYMYSTS